MQSYLWKCTCIRIRNVGICLYFDQITLHVSNVSFHTSTPCLNNAVCHSVDVLTITRPDNCEASTWKAVSNSLNFDFIHGGIQGRSCKKYASVTRVLLVQTMDWRQAIYRTNAAPQLLFEQCVPNRRRTIIWINYVLGYWLIYTSFHLDELTL